MTDEEVQEVIEYITGTCHSLDEVCHIVTGDYGNSISVFQARDLIDPSIFRCDTCGWWFEREEQAANDDGEICLSCAEDA